MDVRLWLSIGEEMLDESHLFTINVFQIVRIIWGLEKKYKLLFSYENFRVILQSINIEMITLD